MQKCPVKLNPGYQYTRVNQSYLDRIELYKSSRWQMIRKNFLIRNPVCCRCGAPAEIVDHIKGHHVNKDIYGKTWEDYFWDKSNYQSMCWSCHSRKTCLEDMKNKTKRLSSKDRAKQLQKLKGN